MNKEVDYHGYYCQCNDCCKIRGEHGLDQVPKAWRNQVGYDKTREAKVKILLN